MSEIDQSLVHSAENCVVSFTTQENLNSHKTKHCTMLSLELETKNGFVADQTPTPTRFIRNCEEVGLFQDLQNVNPFDETFKKATELVKNGCLHVPEACTDDTLHTPHILPHITKENSDKYAINRVPSLDEDLIRLCNKETEISDECTHNFKNHNENVGSKINESNNNSVYKNQENRSDGFSIDSVPSIHQQLMLIDSRESDSDDDVIVIDEFIHEEKNSHVNIDICSTLQPYEPIKVPKNMNNKEKIKEVLLNKVRKDLNQTSIEVNKPDNLKCTNNVAPLFIEAPRKRTVSNVKNTRKTVVNEPVTAERQKVREFNRAAQIRSRARKKLWIRNMEMNNEKLKTENTLLLIENQKLKNELQAVKSILLYHKECETTQDPIAMRQIAEIMNEAYQKNIQLLTEKPTPVEKVAKSKIIPIKPCPLIKSSASPAATNNIQVCLVPSIVSKTDVPLDLAAFKKAIAANSNSKHFIS